MLNFFIPVTTFQLKWLFFYLLYNIENELHFIINKTLGKIITIRGLTFLKPFSKKASLKIFNYAF